MSATSSSGQVPVQSFESPEIGVINELEEKNPSTESFTPSHDIISVDSSQMGSSESFVSTIFLDGTISNEMKSSLTLNQDAPAIDPHAIQDLETHAKRISDQLFHMMSLLKSNLFKISGVTLDCMEIHSKTVDSVCDSVDSNIKAMYALIAKSEEVSKELAIALSVKEEVNEIKRLLDQLEPVIMKDVKKT